IEVDLDVWILVAWRLEISATQSRFLAAISEVHLRTLIAPVHPGAANHNSELAIEMDREPARDLGDRWRFRSGFGRVRRRLSAGRAARRYEDCDRQSESPKISHGGFAPWGFCGAAGMRTS